METLELLERLNQITNTMPSDAAIRELDVLIEELEREHYLFPKEAQSCPYLMTSSKS